ncbi:MAG TPA: DUF4412 domain-containing protein [Thermoanaerobaculia bacterium]|nr:DUF4412 domain-containing protein [Thermoanaerobaculia bacterium]
MKTALLAAAAFLVGAASALAQFEGVADFKVTSVTGKGDVIPGTGRIFVSKAAYRMEWETDISKMGRGKSQSSDAPQHVKITVFGKASDPDTLYLIDDGNKTYSTWDVRKTRGESADAPKTTYTVTRLGPDKVAGLTCQRAELTSSRGTVISVCVAGEFNVSLDWLSAIGRRQKESTSWVAALRDSSLTGFPVRYSMKEKDAAQPFVTLEMTHIDRGPVAANLFEVPAGYKETDFAMGGLSPEQQKAVSDARARMRQVLDKMTPEQRKAYQDAMKKGKATPTPAP